MADSLKRLWGEKSRGMSNLYPGATQENNSKSPLSIVSKHQELSKLPGCQRIWHQSSQTWRLQPRQALQSTHNKLTYSRHQDPTIRPRLPTNCLPRPQQSSQQKYGPLTTYWHPSKTFFHRISHNFLGKWRRILYHFHWLGTFWTMWGITCYTMRTKALENVFICPSIEPCQYI